VVATVDISVSVVAVQPLEEEREAIGALLGDWKAVERRYLENSSP
jgi:hypothetical protein